MPEEMPKASGAPAGPTTEPEIHVIPEKFYGAALKARVPEMHTQKPPETPNDLAQPKAKPAMLYAIIGGVTLLGIGGAFLYFNYDLLFPKSVPPAVVVTPPAPPAPPAAPTDLAATSTNPQSASITWTDASSDESGFRVERADDQGAFIALTNLSSNSSSFLDTSVQPSRTYRYRVIAVNEGGESSPSSEASAVTGQLPPPPPEQVKLPPAGLDTDSDGLTDLEEVLFSTNVRDPDTDKDGFLDGNEAFHLYNPNGLAPGRLVEAGLVKPYSGTIGWSMQVPSPWTLTTTALDGSTATIPTGNGETFKISVEDNPLKLSVLEWYLAKNPTVKREQVLEYRSKRGYVGVIGADLLTTYIPWGDLVFVLTYDIASQPFINYRTTYSMMLNSLELRGVPQLTGSSAKPLPFEPAATATGVIAQPVPVAPENP